VEPLRGDRVTRSPAPAPVAPGLPVLLKVAIGVLAVIGAIAVVGWLLRKLLWLATVAIIVALGVTVVRALSSRSR
jgi:Flp pilus assembly protein TadB